MPRPFETIDTVDTGAGRLELLRRDTDDWLITIDRRVLMSSRLHRSEVALAELACRPLAAAAQPRVLIAGLGMGYTLRAALDVLPADAVVIAAEIDPTVAAWNRGPLASLSSNALDDARTRLEIVDVSVLIANAARAADTDRFDAIVLDLFEGPYPPPAGTEDTLFGPAALARTRAALRPGGSLAVWSEGPVASFETRLESCGFRAELHRPRHKGPRHVVYLAWPAAPKFTATRGRRSRR